MVRNTYSPSVKIVGYLFISLVTLILIESASLLIIRSDIGIISKFLFENPIISEDDFNQYLKQRDEVLGWPSTNWKKDNSAEDGSRISPANDNLQNESTCVSLYGDSFTFADEVSHDLAWGNLLVDRLNCPVRNYGVNGFGTGQAMLRYEHNQNDKADIVILGLFPDDLNRIQNQWRYLLTGNSVFGFKPSFSLDDDGSLLLHAIPVNSYNEYRQIQKNPASILNSEFYLPNQALFLSRIDAQFPYTISLLKVAMKLLSTIDFTNLSRSKKFRHLNYPGWYDSSDGPDSDKTRVFTEIVKRFASTIAQRNKQGLLLLIPEAEMVLDMQANETHSLNEFLAPLKKYIQIIDATPYLAQKSQDRGVCYYYGKSRDCTGHFNKEGNELLAEYVHSQLVKIMH